MVEQYDTEEFINEIKTYPCIWNYKCDSYSNRVERNDAWTELCQKFSQNFSDRTAKERNDIMKALQRKWKTLRDGFNRGLKNCTSTSKDCASSTKRQYLFSKQLSFLLPLAEARCEAPNSLSQISTEDCEDKLNLQSSNCIPKKRKRKSLQSSGDRLIAPLPLHQDKKVNDCEERDNDKYFLLSLHKDLKNIPEEFKLDAKAEMMGVLKKFKRMSSLYQSSNNLNT